MFCSKCGTDDSTDARYCHNCGAALPQDTRMPSELPQVANVSKVTNSIHNSDQTRTSEPNSLVKHWRGDYSLGFSYWVIGSLLSVILVVVTEAIGSSSRVRELGVKASAVVILAAYGFGVALVLWQTVGIWRSASKHSQRGGKGVWAGLAKVMVVFGFLFAAVDFTRFGVPLISESAKLLVGIDNTPPHQIRLLRDGAELELAGGMPFGTADAVREFLDAAPAVQIVHLNSQGGRMSEAYQLYKTIKERNLSTYTSADCVSACSIVFLAGRERYIGESGRLGFHSTAIGELSGDVVEELNDEVRKTLRTHGVPDGFIDRALSTSSKDMWYPSKDELLEAMVIDSVVDSRYFGLSGVVQWRDAHKIESWLLATPIYSALAQYDQQNYAKLRNIFVSGIQRGRAQIEIENDIRFILVSQLIPMYLKKAPDEVLIRYWRSQISELKYLAKLSPQHCADFAFPQFAKTAPNLQQLLPKNLQQEDMDALAAVVKGVATNPQGYASSPRIQKDLEGVVMRGVQKYPEAPDVFRDPENYKDDPASLCSAVIVLYSEVLAIPSSSRSGAVLRYMVSE
ncbi:hypothetical protein AZOA_46860 [Azoarcus sp. Aa7]|nr:hypothetical protein [Azoarcus sp. Aa7]